MFVVISGLWEVSLTILINCLVLASGVANMEGGQVVRAGPSVANFMTMVLDARKPINTFAKLLVDNHTKVRVLRKRASVAILAQVSNTPLPRRGFGCLLSCCFSAQAVLRGPR